MSMLRYTITTRFALLTALGLAAMMAASHASAGSQNPKNNWYRVQAELAALNAARAQAVADNSSESTGDESNYVDETPETPDYTDTGATGGDHGNGSAPAAAPSPSAVAGGLAMIGLLASRRRRQNDDA